MNTRFRILDWIAGGAFSTILSTLKELKMNDAQLVAAINTATDKAEKIGDETRILLAKITDLLEQLTEEEISEEAQEAITALEIQLNVVDELVPDAPIPPEPVPE